MSDMREAQASLITPIEQPNKLEDLIKIGLEALKFQPPFYVQSIFGPIFQWIPPQDKHSEFNIIDLWQPIRTLDYLKEVSIPSFSHGANKYVRTFMPPFVRKMFWRESNYYQQGDPFEGLTSYGNEHWFFVNGVATNQVVAEMNSSFLSEMFLRPITGVHNATNSLLVDLFECAIGKEFKTAADLNDAESMTEPAEKAAYAISKALVDPERDKVVVICHSQGTIIMANVLRAIKVALSELNPEKLSDLETLPTEKTLLECIVFDILKGYFSKFDDKDDAANAMFDLLKKLEIYTFANCANKMTYISYLVNAEGQKVGLPYIENFANRFDLVARLGALSPFRETDPSLIKIDGPIFENNGVKKIEKKGEKKRAGAWGHLLNQHYLYGIFDYLKDRDAFQSPYVELGKRNETDLAQSTNGIDVEDQLKTPRLYEYFSGKRPKPYYD